MAVAAWCAQCGAYAWLDERWSCPAGHGWDQTSAWYDPETSAPVTPPWVAAASAPAAEAAPVVERAPEAPAPAPEAAPVASTPAPAPDDRNALLADILGTLQAYPNYRTAYGTETDITIDNELVDVAWPGGKKKVEFSAILKAVEAERTVYYWEILKEQQSGFSFGSAGSESYTLSGTKRSGKVKATTFTPGGAVDFEWDYGATRHIVEDVAARHGWRVKTVLRKGKAQW